jgi:thiamine-monophosphate kinase
MNREKDIIRLISDILPRSVNQINQCFESDSEILRYGSEILLFTVDEFSNEDLFRDNDPYSLGWNLAVGTLSDILSVKKPGGLKFGMHEVEVAYAYSASYMPPRLDTGMARPTKRKMVLVG